MVPGMTWLPGWRQQPLGSGVRGKPYQYRANPKVCLHTTEGSSVAGAIAAYSPYPPHLVYDWRNRERVQHVPLNLASYSAKDGSDDDYMVQVELVGYARDTRGWPDEALQRIALDVALPLEQHFGVPRRAIWQPFRDERDGVRPYLASTESPIRITFAQLRDFSGWLGHQHLPAPDTHWDPGAFPIARMFAFMEDDMTPDQALQLAEMHERQRGYGFRTELTQAAVDRVEAKVNALVAEHATPAPVALTDTDRAAIAKQVAEGIRADLVPLFELAKRLES